MERIRKCKNCGKELDYFEGCQIPVHIPATPSFRMPSGGADLYCDECYKEVTGETFLEDLEEESGKKYGKGTELIPEPIIEKVKARDKVGEIFQALRKKEPEIVPISDAKVGTNVAISGIIDSEVQHKDIVIKNRNLKMATCKIKDDTGKIVLILWADMTNKAENKKMYRVDGYIQEFNGRKQITLGYKGKIKELII